MSDMFTYFLRACRLVHSAHVLSRRLPLGPSKHILHLQPQREVLEPGVHQSVRESDARDESHKEQRYRGTDDSLPGEENIMQESEGQGARSLYKHCAWTVTHGPAKQTRATRRSQARAHKSSKAHAGEAEARATHEPKAPTSHT